MEDIVDLTPASQLQSEALQSTEDFIDDVFNLSEEKLPQSDPSQLEETEDIINDAFEGMQSDHEDLAMSREGDESDKDVGGSDGILSFEEESKPYVPKTIRRPISSWIIFCNEQRSAIKEANPSYGFKEMAHILSQNFKALTEEEKKIYDEKAALDKERYLSESREEKRLSALYGSSQDVTTNLKREWSLAKESFIPLARVKKTMKMDKDLRNVGKQALMAVSKATELFIAFLSVRSAQIASRNKRRTVNVSDMLEAIHSNSALSFLCEDFPALPPKPKSVKIIKPTPAAAAPASGKASITSFFSQNRESGSVGIIIQDIVVNDPVDGEVGLVEDMEE